jgi:hypothetical protein
MTAPTPRPRDPRTLTGELRDDRAGRRDPGADLVPVEGGEPMPAEEPAVEPRPIEF